MGKKKVRYILKYFMIIGLKLVSMFKRRFKNGEVFGLYFFWEEGRDMGRVIVRNIIGRSGYFEFLLGWEGEKVFIGGFNVV